MQTGFIGLGHMSSEIAQNLVKAGHDFTVFNRTPSRSQALVALGAHEATRIGGACRGETVVTMLSDDTAAAEVTLGNDGIIGSMGNEVSDG